MTEVIFSKEAENDYSKLPKTEQKKINRKISYLSLNPSVGKLLRGKLEGSYAIRAWPYRIIYEIVGRPANIAILRIQHRQGVYK